MANRGWSRSVSAVLALWVIAVAARADEEAIRKELEAVRKEVEELRKERRAEKAAKPFKESAAEKALANKYGPGAAVTSKIGKLQIGGLLKVWYYSIQNDSRGLFDDRKLNDITDTNEASDNDSFRIRRAELHFIYALDEHISARVVIDPSRDGTSFPAFPDNQGLFKRLPNSAKGSVVSGVQTGSASAARMLQDIFLNYKDFIPHHDFQIGQFKPLVGDEALRPSSELDFVERSFLGQLGDFRDLGAFVRGSWKGERLQYWIGAFDGAGNYYQSAGQQQNRSDDNDAKDFTLRGLARPVWKDAKWGSLELGASAQWGAHGESGTGNTVKNPNAGLNHEKTRASRFDAWASYFPGGPAAGLWARGEWMKVTDRNAPGSVIDLLKNDMDGNGVQDNASAFTSHAWYISAGYDLGRAPVAERWPHWARKIEAAFRYQNFENVQTADLLSPARTDVFKTQVYTAGLNYYLKGHNAEIQLNYNWVLDPRESPADGNRLFHNVRNDYFIVNFQVAW